MVSLHQLSHNLQFSIMGLSDFMLIVIFCDFDDEFRVPNSCEFVGMINFMKLLYYVLKLHSCCCC